jgi:hypothetical protein
MPHLSSRRRLSGLRAYQQPQAAPDVAGQPVQQGGEPGPVCWREADLLPVQLPFEDRDLMAQRQDLGILVRVAHRQQPQQREGVGHAEVGQPKQHNGSSRRSAQRRSPPPRNRRARDYVSAFIWVAKVAMTRTDEVFGTRSADCRSTLPRAGAHDGDETSDGGRMGMTHFRDPAWRGNLEDLVSGHARLAARQQWSPT